ncbi:MAG TPA: ATP-binding protein [Candidatus Omnitrophota bacterium]|nr:ATP-binding protein [Candidatus Omnitrophota bacterium]
MKYIPRLLEDRVRHTIKRNKSVLILGARQTGKTTLTHQFASNLSISFVQPDIRQRYEKSPHLLKGEVESLAAVGKGKRPLIILDEVQKIPVILDVVQDLIDREKANFILTGSSARKLRRGAKINLLPGRVVAFRIGPFSLREFPAKNLNERLIYGSLPGILALEDLTDRETDLEAYVTTYLEEEIRAEAVVRNLGDFARFLELAASESGGIINLRKLSQEIGVSHTTIGAYYQILEDCLIAERVEPLTQSKTRKKLTKSEKYLFFDLGVRRLAAREGEKLSRDTMGEIFEQFIGLELLRTIHTKGQGVKVRFWRDPDGPEVDWVIDSGGAYTPLEVKWTDNPKTNDIRHLEVFLSEYKTAKTGYLVCQVPRKAKLSDKITAIPWQSIDEVI